MFPEKIQYFLQNEAKKFVLSQHFGFTNTTSGHTSFAYGEGEYFVGMWRMKGAHVASGLIPSLFVSSCLVLAPLQSLEINM